VHKWNDVWWHGNVIWVTSSSKPLTTLHHLTKIYYLYFFHTLFYHTYSNGVIWAIFTTLIRVDLNHLLFWWYAWYIFGKLVCHKPSWHRHHALKVKDYLSSSTRAISSMHKIPCKKTLWSSIGVVCREHVYISTITSTSRFQQDYC